MKQRLVWAALALMCITGCACETVGSGHGGIGFDSFGSGTLREQFGEGLHVLRPGKSLIVYDLRVQEMKEELSVLSNNGLDIRVDASVRYRAEPTKLFELHTQTGPRYSDILVGPIVRSEARKVFGRYAPEEIYSTKREQIEKEIYDEVLRALEGKHVVVEAVLVRDVTLPQSIRDAIADKLAEEQRSQKMRFTLEKERQEADRKQIEAEGIAKYQGIVRQGLTEEYLRFKGIEATERLGQSTNAKIIVVGSPQSGLPLVYQTDGK
ncbi:prohibitin family protein [Pyxidicoccus xibeiensis]|uniref:prohibitin family protein n=1 Tax=Pyxidicoccus xibeiensis TaxID=2906759 RepID=UPI0020A831EE|nr:prohibitin family protein [Pyxidicoccus xibeiensis]MCP3139877.1 prohibitin family protein [Pyxidicoccus xibeiensis]